MMDLPQVGLVYAPRCVQSAAATGPPELPWLQEPLQEPLQGMDDGVTSTSTPPSSPSRDRAKQSSRPAVTGGVPGEPEASFAHVPPKEGAAPPLSVCGTT